MGTHVVPQQGILFLQTSHAPLSGGGGLKLTQHHRDINLHSNPGVKEFYLSLLPRVCLSVGVEFYLE